MLCVIAVKWEVCCWVTAFGEWKQTGREVAYLSQAGLSASCFEQRVPTSRHFQTKRFAVRSEKMEPHSEFPVQYNAHD